TVRARLLAGLSLAGGLSGQPTPLRLASKLPSLAPLPQAGGAGGGQLSLPSRLREGSGVGQASPLPQAGGVGGGPAIPFRPTPSPLRRAVERCPAPSALAIQPLAKGTKSMAYDDYTRDPAMRSTHTDADATGTLNTLI